MEHFSIRECLRKLMSKRYPHSNQKIKTETTKPTNAPVNADRNQKICSPINVDSNWHWNKMH